MNKHIIEGFSKLNKPERIDLLSGQLDLPSLREELAAFNHAMHQERIDGFSENTLTSFSLPYGIAPNFMIDGEIYHVPMVIEESSVVAAASAAAKFWQRHGGFHTGVRATRKTGQVHFLFHGNPELLRNHWEQLRLKLLESVAPLVANMEKRGGGIVDLALENYTESIQHYYQLHVTFETADSMGANFINSVLETMAATLLDFANENFEPDASCEVIMSILSNYTPECLVYCSIEAPVSAFGKIASPLSATQFAEKFATAVQIAHTDVRRAVTHNKGIMNGADAVVLATGNDFRAVEAGVHAYATRKGTYSSLSQIEITNGRFIFSLELPVAVGTVGGLTALHPLANLSLRILGNPSSQQLMRIIAAVGMANHFSAIRALITGGIQSGHMKMHLGNILHQLKADEDEKEKSMQWFSDKKVSYMAVREFLEKLRNDQEL